TSAGARLSGSAKDTACPSELVETIVVPLVTSEAKRDLRMAFSAAFGSVGLFSRAPRMMQRMNATRLTFIEGRWNVKNHGGKTPLAPFSVSHTLIEWLITSRWQKRRVLRSTPL